VRDQQSIFFIGCCIIQSICHYTLTRSLDSKVIITGLYFIVRGVIVLEFVIEVVYSLVPAPIPETSANKLLSLKYFKILLLKNNLNYFLN
jgi:hypothetical protein